MVLQNELIDEDLEHFEDAADDDAHESADAKRNASGLTDNDSVPHEDGAASSDSEGNASDEGNDVSLKGGQDNLEVSQTTRDGKERASEATNVGSTLPGGYDMKKREPLYCNADRTSWWELMVLAAHVHPSVATMARTLLSGANIVYNGNPLVDLSLTAFLDKFMEKKPKQSTWHGVSDIEPTKKLDMNNQLIGAEILSLAESDVPPEDLVFHKFYANKLNSSNRSKKKKKKKLAEDEAAEELYGEDDQSDDDEIENMLGSSNPSLESDGDYDYDDLDNIANDDDDDLIGHASDEEMDFPSADVSKELEDAEISFEAGGGGDDDDDEIALGEEDDGIDEEDTHSKTRKRKGKKHKHASASPFASIEDYEHLINEDGPKIKEELRTKKKRRKSSE